MWHSQMQKMFFCPWVSMGTRFLLEKCLLPNFLRTVMHKVLYTLCSANVEPSMWEKQPDNFVKESKTICTIRQTVKCWLLLAGTWIFTISLIFNWSLLLLWLWFPKTAEGANGINTFSVGKLLGLRVLMPYMLLASMRLNPTNLF